MDYTEVLEISKYNLAEAQFMASNFKDKSVMNRVFFNVIGAQAFILYLKNFGILNSNLYNIHSIKRVVGKIDIADVILDNIHIDVRVVFDEDVIFIPKQHFYYGITPDLYVVLKYDYNFQKINLIGYFEPSALNLNNSNDTYYFLEPEKLQSPIDIMDFISNFSGTTEKNITEEQILRAKELSVSIADEDFADNEMKEYLGLLLKNKQLRNSVMEFDNFETLAFNISRTLKSYKLTQNEVIDINDFMNFDSEEEHQDNESETTSQPEDANGDSMLDEVEPSVEPSEQITQESQDIGAIAAGVASAEAVDLAAIAGEELSDMQEADFDSDFDLDSEEQVENQPPENEFEFESVTPEEISEQTEAENTDNNDISNEDDTLSIDNSEAPTDEISEELEMDDIQIDLDDNNFDELLTELPVDVEDEAIKEEIGEEQPPENREEIAYLTEENIEDDSELSMNETTFEPEQEIIDEFETPSTETEKTDIEQAQSKDNEDISDLFEDSDNDLTMDENATDFPDLDLSEQDLSLDDFGNDTLSDEETTKEPTEDIVQDDNTVQDNIETLETDENIQYTNSDDLPDINEDDISIENPEFDNTQNNEDNSNDLNFVEEPINIDNNEEPQETLTLNNIETETQEDDKSDFDFTIEPPQPENENNIQEQGFTSNIDDFLTDFPTEPIEEPKSPESELINMSDLTDMNNIKPYNAEVNFDNADDNSSFETIAPIGDNSEVGYSTENDEDYIVDNTFFDSSAISENSYIISDKTLTPGEITIDINKTDITPEMPQDTNLGQLYSSGASENQSYNNDVRVTRGAEAPKSNVMLYAGIGGIMFVLVVAGVILFSVSKYLNPGQNVQDPMLANNNIPQGNNLNPDAPNTTGLNNNNIVMNNNSQDFPNRNNGAKAQQDNSNSYSKPIPATAFISVKKLSWEVPDYISYDANFKQYFQSAGKSIKAGLSSDLLLATDYALTSQMKVSILYAKDGTFKQAKVLSSSGSSQIDDIVLQSVNQTLRVLRAPNSLGNDESTTVILKIYM